MEGEDGDASDGVEDSFLGFASATVGTKDTTFTTVYTQLLTIRIIDFLVKSSYLTGN